MRARSFAYALRLCLGTGLVFCLQGCVNAPLQETKAFRAGVIAVTSASDVLYDQLNVAEKNTKLRLLRNTESFQVKNAYYYATIVSDFPQTAPFRRAIKIIGQYANLLQDLLEGTGNEAIRGQIISIASTAATFTGQPEFGGAAQAFAPFIDQALLWESRTEARNLVMVGAAAVPKLIDDLRDSTPAMFYLLRTDVIAREGPNSAKLSSYKTVLGNYVVLLDQLETTFEKLLAAYQQPSNLAQIEALSEATGELNSGVKAMRQALAEAK